MEAYQLYSVIAISAVAIVGLIMVILQKKGIIHPLVPTSPGGNFMSGGLITLLTVLVGTEQLWNYSIPAAVAYAAAFAGAYVLIQIFVHEKSAK